MNNFDLNSIHHLLCFADMCTTNNEYMTEASSLPRIELDTTPLYVIQTKMEVLFTPKLRYYRLWVENEVNRHINAATKLLEDDGSEQLTKYVLKKTREAVTTLVGDANRALAELDHSGLAWKNITSDHPVYDESERPVIERVVFYHYLTAELARCWLELQDRYAYVIGQAGCYDVSLFYTAHTHRHPDEEFQLSRSEKYVEEAKSFKKYREDCCFLYDNEEYFAIAIQNFTNILKKHHLIPHEYDHKRMESLFCGRPCRNKFQWTGDDHFLTHIIKGLTDDENPVITAWPEGTPKWQVVQQRFVDKDNQPFKDTIRSENSRKKSVDIYNEAVAALKNYL